MARNRKRAKERRARRPQGASVARPRLATADPGPEEATPDPLEHASADAELAEAQMALGRPELVEPSNNSQPSNDAEPFDDQELGEGPEIPGVLPQRPHLEHAGPEEIGSEAAPEQIESDVGPEEIEGDELEQVQAHAPEPRARGGNRLVNFLLGSWRELQRVQWPDRRQVMQATGVVIGFVIVAGVFLGVADALSAQIVKFILK